VHRGNEEGQWEEVGQHVPTRTASYKSSKKKKKILGKREGNKCSCNSCKLFIKWQQAKSETARKQQQTAAAAAAEPEQH